MVDEVAGGSPEERDGGAKVAGGWASPEKASQVMWSRRRKDDLAAVVRVCVNNAHDG